MVRIADVIDAAFSGERAARLARRPWRPANVRPPEVEDRLIPDYWAGDLIKDTANRSLIDILANVLFL